MILGQISWLDIAVFLIFLAPQLIYQVGLINTVICGLRALPFLLLQLPRSVVAGYISKPSIWRSNVIKPAKPTSLFQMIVIACVRYAFASIPASVGRVFFSKYVALPFLRFRQLRHGFLKSPIEWEELSTGKFKGVLVRYNSSRKPDVVIYYAHGGGFSMGSAYFYLEFLLTWTHLLRLAGFENPAVLALEYTLVPDKCYPTQLNEAIAGYEYIESNLTTASRICVAGDSAGGTIMLSLLLHIARAKTISISKPGMAALISPWTTLWSINNRNTPSDYLNEESLELYGLQYAGNKTLLHDPVVSPGCCEDMYWWHEASPEKGWYVMWGSEEVFAPEIAAMVTRLREASSKFSSKSNAGENLRPFVGGEVADGGIHAWPVASLFLGSCEKERLAGIRSLVAAVKDKMLC